MLARAKQVASHVFLPNIDLDTVEPMLALAQQEPQFCFPMLGIHPCHVTPNYQNDLETLAPLYHEHRFYGVGETGLDLYWDEDSLPRQQEALRWHAEKAKELQLPLILHAREAFSETADIVAAAQDGSLRGIFHCFTENLEAARRALDLGFHLGIGGVVTYKKTDLRETLQYVPRDRVVLETDSPYLAPVPRRGKRNETAYIQYVADTVAEAWGETPAAVARHTTANALKLFGLRS